jgi:hypothetical protein
MTDSPVDACIPRSSKPPERFPRSFQARNGGLVFHVKL